MKNRKLSQINFHLLLTTFLICAFFFNRNEITAQDWPGIPQSLCKTTTNTPPTSNEIIQNYFDLIADPDPSLDSQKKKASRWMTYVFGELNVNDADPSLAINQAIQNIYSSPLECDGSDPSNWQSDGPNYMPDWNPKRAAGGRVDGVYSHPTNLNLLLCGTHTSGIFRSTNGGANWNCVTDAVDFPVLGIKQLLASPDDADLILAVTGDNYIEGGVIYSDDAGLTWNEPTTNVYGMNWVDFHPTIQGLVVGVADEELFFSMDYGLNWQTLGQPTGYVDLHKKFLKLIVLDDKILCISDYKYTYGCELWQGDLIVSGSSISIDWSNNPNVSNTYTNSNTYLNFADFSNKVGGRFYLHLQSYDNGCVCNSTTHLLKSLDYGDTYNDYGILIQNGNFRNNALMASPNDPNVVYYGGVSRIKKYDESNNTTIILPVENGNSGFHDDHRGFHIQDINGQDRIFVGHDGGVGLIDNGLSTSSLLKSVYGDLSISMIHAFDIHEKTGRAIFAFQDHAMRYRNTDNTYSSTFLWEGAGAFINQWDEDAMVGEQWTGGIKDRVPTSRDIVNGSLGSPGTTLEGYFASYRHYPDRFIRGLNAIGGGVVTGSVAMNREAQVSEVVSVTQGADPIGAVAFCERDPNYIYCATWGSGDGVFKMSKSSDDGYNWTNMNSSTISLDNGATQGLLSDYLRWNRVRAIAVDHTDPQLIYCGIGRVHDYNFQVTDERFRVIKSTNGGTSFTDYSEGLPAFPVERLLTIESDNDLIFCATSVGIYYRTSTMNQWECYSEKLPKARITGLKFEYCNKVLYASTYGRGLWKTDVNLPIVTSYVTSIDNNTLWDEDRIVKEDVIITDGNTLTITAEIRMQSENSIIVEQGGTLVIDGGLVTNYCGDVWAGIKVWGNYNLTQTASNQGRVILKNNAIIENASNAITTWNPGDWSTTGGIIQATNSIFRNNRRSVEFLAYQNTQSNGYVAPNRSYFKNCIFETNEDYPIPNEGNMDMITMYKVNGVKITGCDFIYDRTVSGYTELRGAIYTIDANFSVDNYCNTLVSTGQPCPTANTEHSTFTGFNKAIHVTGASWNVGPEIKDAVFSENMQGINLDAVVAPAATFNDFTVGNNSFQSTFGDDNPNFHLGIKVNNCDEYIVEENEFTGDDINGWATHGVYAYNNTYSGNSNELYKNDYSDVSAASIASGNHANPNSTNSFIGLRFICNQNQNNINDFEVRPFNGILFSEISNYQNGGFPAIPAGNTFSTGNSGDNIFAHLDFYSNSAYSYLANVNDVDPSAAETYITPPGTITITTTPSTNTCVTNYPEPGGGISPGLTYGKFKTGREEYGNLYYSYLQLIDAGNTDAMITEIDLSWPTDAWNLHGQLMARSPYNSETVLMAAADRDILTHGMLLEILLANPDALRSGTVISHVGTNLTNPMPQYMIDILVEASRDPSTVRSGMEKNLSNLHLDMIRSHKRIAHKHLNDTIVGFHPDTLIKYFSSVRSLVGRYQQVYAYTGLHQYVNAQAVIDSISIYYKLNSQQEDELDNTENFVNFLEYIHNDGRNVAQLQTSEIADLLLISEVILGGIAAERAENILCFFYNECAEDKAAPKNNAVKIKKPRISKEILEEALNSLNVAPNPGNSYVEFEYDIFKSSKDNSLRITDIQGRPIKFWELGSDQRGIKVLNTRKLPNGIYFYELTQDGEKLKYGKFIVQH